MLNPALIEIAARDRIAERRRDGARHAFVHRSDIARVDASPTTGGGSPQRAIGWFLISVGLRLAVPRPRTRTLR